MAAMGPPGNAEEEETMEATKEATQNPNKEIADKYQEENK